MGNFPSYDALVKNPCPHTSPAVAHNPGPFNCWGTGWEPLGSLLGTQKTICLGLPWRCQNSRRDEGVFGYVQMIPSWIYSKSFAIQYCIDIFMYSVFRNRVRISSRQNSKRLRFMYIHSQDLFLLIKRRLLFYFSLFCCVKNAFSNPLWMSCRRPSKLLRSERKPIKTEFLRRLRKKWLVHLP